MWPTHHNLWIMQAAKCEAAELILWHSSPAEHEASAQEERCLQLVRPRGVLHAARSPNGSETFRCVKWHPIWQELTSVRFPILSLLYSFSRWANRFGSVNSTSVSYLLHLKTVHILKKLQRVITERKVWHSSCQRAVKINRSQFNEKSSFEIAKMHGWFKCLAGLD